MHLIDNLHVFRQHNCATREELVQLLERKYSTLYGEYGVIVFLYSLLLTKVSLLSISYVHTHCFNGCSHCLCR